MSNMQKRLIFLMFLTLALLGFGQIFSTAKTVRLRQAEPTTPPSGETQPSFLLTGTVIREETVIYAPETADWQPTLESGQRAAAGQALFTAGGSRSTRQLAKALAAARQSIALQETPLPQRRQTLQEAIVSYNQEDASDVMLTALLLSEGGGGQTLLTETEAAISSAALRSEAVITAPESGTFSRMVDGLESVLTPAHPTADPAELPEAAASPLALGRLITSDTWYFSVTAPFSAAQGDTLEAQLLGGGFGTCHFTVETAEKVSGGWLLLLSCRERLDAAADVRELTVKLSKK